MSLRDGSACDWDASALHPYLRDARDGHTAAGACALELVDGEDGSGDICRVRNVQVSDTLSAFMARAVVLENAAKFPLDKELNESDVQERVLDALAMLRQRRRGLALLGRQLWHGPQLRLRRHWLLVKVQVGDL